MAFSKLAIAVLMVFCSYHLSEAKNLFGLPEEKSADEFDQLIAYHDYQMNNPVDDFNCPNVNKDDYCSDENTMSLQYKPPNSENGFEIECGKHYSILHLTQTHAPTVSLNIQGDKPHTLLMFDPDAPGRCLPIFCSWMHWLVVNIEGHDLSTGETIATYLRPMSPRGSKVHRYTFVLLKQEEKFDTNKMEWKAMKLQFHDNLRRGGFNVDHFIAQHHFQSVYTTFFQTEWADESNQKDQKI